MRKFNFNWQRSIQLGLFFLVILFSCKCNVVFWLVRQLLFLLEIGKACAMAYGVFYSHQHHRKRRLANERSSEWLRSSMRMPLVFLRSEPACLSDEIVAYFSTSSEFTLLIPMPFAENVGERGKGNSKQVTLTSLVSSCHALRFVWTMDQLSQKPSHSPIKMTFVIRHWKAWRVIVQCQMPT